MGFLTALLIILIVAIIAFVVWFVVYRFGGKCPICALEKITKPTKITMDVENEEPYSAETSPTPPNGLEQLEHLPPKYKRGFDFRHGGSHEKNGPA